MPAFKDALMEAVGGLTPDEEKMLPSGYQRIGDIIILNLNPALRPRFSAIGKAVKERFKVAAVCARTGPIEGELREPQAEVIAGDSTLTTHREGGVLYRIDVSKVMFSKGNAAERQRMAEAVKKDETVVDMFAGIGYFSLPMAKSGKPRMVYAIELNPTAMRFLRENIRLNGLTGRITPILGDCRSVPMGSVADRVVMGYLPDTWRYLEYALSYLKPGGGIVHYHDIFHKKGLWEEPVERLERHAYRYGLQLQSLAGKRIVKEYAPGRYHVVVDAKFKAY